MIPASLNESRRLKLRKFSAFSEKAAGFSSVFYIRRTTTLKIDQIGAEAMGCTVRSKLSFSSLTLKDKILARELSDR